MTADHMNTLMAAKGRLDDIQRQLEARGVRDIKITWAGGITDQPLSYAAHDLATALEAYLAGKFHPLPPLNDRPTPLSSKNELRRLANVVALSNIRSPDIETLQKLLREPSWCVLCGSRHDLGSCRGAVETPARLGELEQLRRIDRAARAFADAPAGQKTEAAWHELEQALYDGRHALKTSSTLGDSNAREASLAGDPSDAPNVRSEAETQGIQSHDFD